MPIVSNTSPLIALARIQRLDFLKKLYGSVIIPPSVKVECVDKGKFLGAQDAYEIEKGIEEGWITVLALRRGSKTRSKNLMRHAQIGQGEAEALMVAKDKKLAVILDDAEARAVARSLRVEYLGTVMVPYAAYVRRDISYGDLVRVLADLSKVLWISPSVIAEILRKAEEMRK